MQLRKLEERDGKAWEEVRKAMGRERMGEGGEESEGKTGLSCSLPSSHAFTRRLSSPP